MSEVTLVGRVEFGPDRKEISRSVRAVYPASEKEITRLLRQLTLLREALGKADAMRETLILAHVNCSPDVCVTRSLIDDYDRARALVEEETP